MYSHANFFSGKPKVLFVLKKRANYGISYGLVNSCKFILDALKPLNIECKIVQVEDNNRIDREVHLFKPTHVFVEALWVVPSKFEVLLPLHKKVKWFVRLHSQTPFLGYEGIAFEWIKEYAKLSKKHTNFHVASNSSLLVEDVKAALGLDMKYAPNVYLFKKTINPTTWGKETIDIGCFGAVRPFKNHLNQALAAIAFANEYNLKLRFHINASRFENLGESILKNLRAIFKDTPHHLVEHNWSNHSEFLELVRRMDLGIQVSYTETFNIVAADFVANNIPMVGSKEIEWLSPLYQADPNQVEDMKRKIAYAYFGRILNLQRVNENKLNRFNKKSIEAWLQLLH